MDMVKAIAIAQTCYEANRAWCRANGDYTQQPWHKAPQWMRDSNIAGVMFHDAEPDAGDNASHEAWMKHKIAEGWCYGPVKDEVAKTHPCLMPFDKLPEEQQVKDRLFRFVVHALLSKSKDLTCGLASHDPEKSQE